MTEVISVRFRGGCKNYDFSPNGLTLKMGEEVVVETAQGLEFATCTVGNHEVEDSAVVQPLSPVLRRATDADRATVERNRRKESEAFDICEKKIADHGLEMKLVNVSCSFDSSKIIFFFTADGRVDFRELVRDLASVFRARIELRQIGVRDEAKMVGGLGICGRPFCCSQFLDSFLPVSIKMAKTQNLSLNPTKISGTCGRLMCCLKYEQDAYEDAIKRMPKNDSFVLTPDGPGNVSNINVLKETVNVRLDERPDAPRCYHNCEVCVLRNGKGSRDGIAVPKERPERYVEPVAAEEMLIPNLFADYGMPSEPAEQAQEERPARRRSRGGRRRGKGSENAAPAAETARETPKQEKRPAKPAKADKPEQSESREPRREGEGGQRRRRSRGGRGRGNGGDSAAKQTETAARPAPPAADTPARQEGEGGQRRRRSRGGRRRSRSGGGTPPASEA